MQVPYFDAASAFVIGLAAPAESCMFYCKFTPKNADRMNRLAVTRISFGIYCLLVVIAILSLSVPETEAMSFKKLKSAWNMLKMIG